MANVAEVLGAEPRLSRRRFLGLALPLAGAALAACSGASAPSTGGERIATSGALVAWPAKNQWPDLFWRAAPEVQEAYRFAVAHPDVLQYIPCYCGCVDQGHRSNADCYVQEVRADGSVVLDPMSFG